MKIQYNKNILESIAVVPFEASPKMTRTIVRVLEERQFSLVVGDIIRADYALLQVHRKDDVQIELEKTDVFFQSDELIGAIKYIPEESDDNNTSLMIIGKLKTRAFNEGTIIAHAPFGMIISNKFINDIKEDSDDLSKIVLFQDNHGYIRTADIGDLNIQVF